MTRYYKADVFEAPDRLFQIRQASRTQAQVWLQADRPAVVCPYHGAGSFHHGPDIRNRKPSDTTAIASPAR